MTTITIYSTASCAACHELTKWLEKNNIEYTKKITDEDPAAMDEFMQVNDGMIGVPFTVVEDGGEETKISGFDRAKFTTVLGL
jgi:glutaredoxin